MTAVWNGSFMLRNSREIVLFSCRCTILLVRSSGSSRQPYCNLTHSFSDQPLSQPASVSLLTELKLMAAPIQLVAILLFPGSMTRSA
jgi:hypothetical protein